MKINFKRPKFIIPLLLLPFILLFYFIFSNWAENKGTSANANKDSAATGGINPSMPGVSQEVSSSGIKDKFQAYLEAYKHQKDASALDNIENNPLLDHAGDFKSAYSSEDLKRIQSKRQLDSLQRALQSGQAEIDQHLSQLSKNINQRKHGAGPTETNLNKEQLLNGFAYDQEKQAPDKKDQSYNEQVQLFRDQMAIMDSMQQVAVSKAPGQTSSGNSTEEGPKKKRTLTNNFDKEKFIPSKDSSFKPLAVSRNRSTPSAFNTVAAFQSEKHIAAMIDQDIKAIAGSRVRIRLLNDIFVGDKLIPKGSYIYGVVSGFQTQRINISVKQIQYENEPLPVNLDVYDNDGYLGLYVPGSTFREFTKEIGTQGTQGLSQVYTSDNSNVTGGMISQIFQSASTSVSKLIQKEKAFLKYNYVVYLKVRNQ